MNNKSYRNKRFQKGHQLSQFIIIFVATITLNVDAIMSLKKRSKVCYNSTSTRKIITYYDFIETFNIEVLLDTYVSKHAHINIYNNISLK